MYRRDRDDAEARRLAQKRDRELMLNILADQKDELWDDTDKTFRDLQRVDESKIETRVPNYVKNDLLPKPMKTTEETREVALFAKHMNDHSIKKAADALYRQNREAILADTTYVDREIFSKIMTPVSEQKNVTTRRSAVGRKTESLNSETLDPEDVESTDPEFMPVKNSWKNNYKSTELSSNNPLRLARSRNDSYVTKMRREEKAPEYPSIFDGVDLEDVDALALALGLKIEEDESVPKKPVKRVDSLEDRQIKARAHVSEALSRPSPKRK